MDWEAYAPLVLCLALALGGAFAFAVAISSLSWPSVKGRIVVSFVDQELERNGNEYRMSENHQLAYSYTVDGVDYLGAHIKPWGSSDWTLNTNTDSDSDTVIGSGARDAAHWYRPDAIVDVYYCPWRPRWACLEPGGFFIPLLLGAMALGTYLFFVR